MNKNIPIIMILGVSLMVTTMTNTANAEESIGIFSLQSEIVKTDDIHITGFVNTDSFYKPVKLQIYDPNGNIVFMPEVRFDDQGQFSWLIHPPLGKFDVIGTYTIIASHEDIDKTAQIDFVVVQDTESNNSWLKTVMIKSDSLDEVNSQNKIIEIQQETTQKGVIPTQQQNADQNALTQSSPKVNNSPVTGDQENTITSGIQEDLSAQQEQVQTTDNEFIETLELPLFMTIIAVTIAGIIAGIVIWMRQTYEKPIVQK